MIKLLIMDCDGVLADGKIIYTEDKHETKAFSVADGLGISLIRAVGIKTAVITGRESLCLKRRCRDLQIDFLYQKVKNKVAVAEELLKHLSLSWEEVAFIGDDWNDYNLLQKVGLAAAPRQAFPQIKKRVHFVAERDGGDGAVREFIEYILEKQGQFEEAVRGVLESLSRR